MIYEGNDFMKLKKNWVKIVLFVLGVVILAVAAYICLPKILQLLGFLVKLFLPFLLGYLFSMAVNPLADTLQKRLKIPRGLSAVLVIVLIVGIFGGVLTFAIWKIVDEGRMLYTQFPTIYENIQNSTKALGEKWSVVYMNLPSKIFHIFTGCYKQVHSVLLDSLTEIVMCVFCKIAHFKHVAQNCDFSVFICIRKHSECRFNRIR